MTHGIKSAIDLLLEAPVDLRALISKLEFSEEDVARAAREQARLFLEASRYRVLCMRKRMKAEAAYKLLCSQESLKLRRAKRALADKKDKSALTEKFISDRVSVEPNVVQARRQLDLQTVYEEWGKLLVDAYKQRRDACRILAEIMGAEASAELRIVQSEASVRGMKHLRREVDSRWPGREDAEEES